MMPLITPFHRKYVELKAQMIDLAGWTLASQFSSVDEEYKMVRERAGFCDYAFQGVFFIAGKEAFRFLQMLTVNDIGKIRPGKAIYTSMLDTEGSIINDTIIFWMDDDTFIVHSGLKKKMLEDWIRSQIVHYSASVTEIATTFLSIQGPKSRDVLMSSVEIEDLEFMELKRCELNGIPALIARTGFSGELGYEIHIYPEYADDLWDTLMDLGKDYDVGPYGLSLAGPLSVEKGYLDGPDFFAGGTLIEYGLEWTIAFDKGEFFGKDALLARKREGIKKKLVGFEVLDTDVVPSSGTNLLKDKKIIGQVTASAHSPILNKTIGRAWVYVENAAAGEELYINQGGIKTKISIAKSYRFYDPKGTRLKI